MEYPATTATVETLPNGLTLILQPEPANPVISTQIWVETGSMHEDQHLGSGISHFLEHMVFKGTRDFDAGELAATVQSAGGHWNAYTSFDRTVYYIDGPSDSLAMFLKCLTGLVFFPILPESEFEKEKDIIRREIDMGLDDPDNAASRLLFSTAFQRDPRRHPVIGHRHLFDQIQYHDLTTYHRTRYTTDRCFMVISGDFDPQQARQSLIDHTRECQPGCGKEPLLVTDPPQVAPRFARDTFAVPASKITLAWKIPSIDHPDALALDVLATLLGRGRSARLYRRIREEKGLALEISSFSWSSPAREGLFAINAEAEPSIAGELVDAIMLELADIQSSGLSEEIEKAKRQIITSQFRSLTTASGRAADLASNWLEARDLDFTRRQINAIKLITEADIRRAATRLTRERLIHTVIDPLDTPATSQATSTRREKAEATVHTLPNGLRIALLPDRRVPLVHIQAAVRAGLPSETSATNGINQLLASTLPKGTTTRSAPAIAVSLESLGASVSAHAGNNALMIQAGGLANDAAEIIDLFADVMLNPSLNDEAIAPEKASQLAALEEAQQDPLHVGFRTLRAAAFSGTSYGLEPLGSHDSLAALNRSSLANHHARHFNATNTTIAITGDFDSVHMLSLITEKFAALPAGEIWTPPDTIPAQGADLIHHLPKKQAVITIGYHGASAISSDRRTLAMIHEYASDMAGPLFTHIRENLGLAYQVGASQFHGYDSGLFIFYVATSPEQAALARIELLKEIEKIAHKGIPDAAFERVRATLISSLAIQQQSLARTSQNAALNLLFGLPIDEDQRTIEAYRNMTPNMIADTAEQIFSQAATIATVMPAHTEA
jgi:zinc protease